MNNRRRTLLIAGLLCVGVQPCLSLAQTSMDLTVDAATGVLDEIMSVPAKQIPQYLLADAHGVAIIPNVVKGGFVVGVRHGRGVALIRDDMGQWNPPIFVSLTGGSVGWQAGIQSTDVVLIFRTRKSIDGLMSGRLTVGVDAAVAAGPVGRQAAAATDTSLGAEILSYSRSRGLFAGVSLDGSLMQLDHAAGSAYYHTPIVGANGQGHSSVEYGTALRDSTNEPPGGIQRLAPDRSCGAATESSRTGTASSRSGAASTWLVVAEAVGHPRRPLARVLGASARSSRRPTRRRDRASQQASAIRRCRCGPTICHAGTNAGVHGDKPTAPRVRHSANSTSGNEADTPSAAKSPVAP
jgi:lipid-binding SYLF domain-containing protein